MFKEATLADIPAIRAAHGQDDEAGTGLTVFIAEQGCACGVDVRGGGPATRETDLLRPENMVQDIHAVVISGGSAFGLESDCGVANALSEEGIGFKLAGQSVPIVCGASLFDLAIGEPAWPDIAMGREAAIRALSEGEHLLSCGNVGAGCGATVGKMGLPEQAMKSGFAWSGLRLGDIVVIANVAVNAVGNVMDENGSYLAGVLGPDGNIMDPLEAAIAASSTRKGASQAPSNSGPAANTTLGVILTNAMLSKAQATKVSQITQDAYARCIKPVHSLNDGDTVFTMATREVEADTDLVGMMATEAMERAIRKAVRSAEGAFGLKSAKDL